jgi:hypothetical protein
VNRQPEIHCLFDVFQCFPFSVKSLSKKGANCAVGLFCRHVKYICNLFGCKGLFGTNASLSFYSEKAALTKHLEEEDIVSLTSITPSEGSLQSGISVGGSTSLPDLLQPEFLYKKQADTGLV